MKQWTQALQATLQVASEWVSRDWHSLAEWQAASTVPAQQAERIGHWFEAFVGQPLVAAFLQHREQHRLLGKQVRDELFVLLAELDAEQAMAVLCRLPSAGALGYSQHNLSLFANVDLLQVREWEQQAYRRMYKSLSAQTPLLAFVAQQLGETVVDTEDVLPERQRLLQEARGNADFDLRDHMTAAMELALRQRLHRMQELDAEELAAPFGQDKAFLAELVRERMKWEMSGGEGEEERADDGANGPA